VIAPERLENKVESAGAAINPLTERTMELRTSQSLLRIHRLSDNPQRPGALRRQLAAFLERLREPVEPRRTVDNDNGRFSDPLDHPALKAMSGRELADIPFARLAVCPDDGASKERAGKVRRDAAMSSASSTPRSRNEMRTTPCNGLYGYRQPRFRVLRNSAASGAIRPLRPAGGNRREFAAQSGMIVVLKTAGSAPQGADHPED
jgi:hypothetical protein